PGGAAHGPVARRIPRKPGEALVGPRVPSVIVQPLPYADPGTPVLTSPARFLGWVGRGQWRVLALAMAWGIVWMVSQALVPATVSRAIDRGVIGGDSEQLLVWSLAVLGLGLLTAVTGMVRHRYAVLSWMAAAFRSVQVIGWHSADTGEALPRHTPTGDVVATVASDSMRLGGLYDVVSRLAGAVASFVVVAVILLRASTTLGLVVLVGVPLTGSLLTLLVRPLHRRQAQQREESGRLIGLGADTVTGLRVLRGLGGEASVLRRYVAQSQRVRQIGFRVAGVQAALDAAQVLLPGLFVLVVTWLGARFALSGQITPGQLVACYGYTAFLVLPLRTATDFVDRWTRALIAARKIIRVLSVPADHADPSAGDARRLAPMPSAHVPLLDERSGVVVRPGELLAVVSDRPHESAALADRLGRFGTDVHGVRLDGTELTDLPLDAVRRRVLVSESDPRLFTGTLRDELDPWAAHTDVEILAALGAASGEDILDALPHALDSQVEERGRSYSGGQRQRLALTRALLRDAEILALVEPTSAVDAHTEARIASRLAAYRRGRTTVVMSVSPLVLDQADRVVLVRDGIAVASGTHLELLHDPAYRAVVVRGEASGHG
ncbi:MAG: ABC transporter ATP-binding protein, partial [Dermatophilaceae bacterium]